MVERWFEPLCSCSCEEGIKMCKIITILNEVLSEVSANCEGEEDFIKEKLEESSSRRGGFFLVSTFCWQKKSFVFLVFAYLWH